MTALSATEVRVLSRLLERARALPAAEREAWLAALPEPQQLLVPRLRERLAQLAQDEEAGPAAPPPLPPKPPPRPEVRVGPYRLLEPLGGDEQGRVWSAERGEGAARQRVALRLPSLRGADGADGAAAPSNPAERQVVLLPAHPDILRLIDAGIDAEGRFYRVLPQVEGLGLLENAQRRGYGERALAQLMLKVAGLVAHVHAEEVACGGLGLASLRVDDEGRVLLLDWAQGRALRADTVAADIQALGRMLQTLLAGAEAGVPTPAGAPRPKAVTPGPDLAWVLKRALHAAGVAPYGSVQALADDLKLVLAFRPVPGAPGGTLHLAQLYLRRHRLALGAGALVAVLLGVLVNVGLGAYQRGRAQDQRSDQVQVFLQEHLPPAADAGASGATPDLAQEAPRLQQALERARMGFAGEPVLRGQVITALGVRFRALGQPEQALAVLQEAVTLLQGTARADDPALQAARAEMALQLLDVGGAQAPAQAAALARQVLDGCSAGDACVKTRALAQRVLQQAGGGR